MYDDLVALHMLLGHTHIGINYDDSEGNSALLLAAIAYDGLNFERDEILAALVIHPNTLINIATVPVRRKKTDLEEGSENQKTSWLRRPLYCTMILRPHQ